MPKAYVMTATPTYTSENHTDFTASLVVAGMHCVLRDIWLDPRFANGFSLVEYGRNWLVGEFLENPKYTHLFWIDSDLFFQPDALARLVQHKKDVVAGVYTTKNEINPTYPYTQLGPSKDGLIPCERIPGGFICMTRKAVEKVASDCQTMKIEHGGETRVVPRFFDLHLDHKPEGNNLIGEDYIACARLRKAGFTVWVDPDIRFKHWGRKAWPAHLAETLREEDAKGNKGQNSQEAWEENQVAAEESLKWVTKR